MRAPVKGTFISNTKPALPPIVLAITPIAGVKKRPLKVSFAGTPLSSANFFRKVEA
jgi:hypothetical protein